ncbi:MAG: acylneuraminate cytidylyltransferase family protein [Haliea sp.]
MIEGRSVIAVIPARGGSKGIPLKNLREVGGVSLIARVAHVARSVATIDRVVTSTDDDRIARQATEAGASAPFRRPPELSGDRVGDWEVLEHALLEMEARDQRRYDIIVMLQPTSPLRRPSHVEAAIAKLVTEGWDAVWTVSETDSKAHPLKQLQVLDGSLEYYDPHGASILARQQLRPVFHRNGIAYVITREAFFASGSLKGGRTGALILNGTYISIDTERDIELAEFAMKSGG